MIDSKTNIATVKIANLLGFEVRTKLKLDMLGSASVNATKTVLTGDVFSRDAKPDTPETVTLDKSTELTLKPFSLTVLSFPLK